MQKKVCELFAGVGGFRLGLERLNSGWETVWFSQWEPGKKSQWAHECYVAHFGDSLDLTGKYTTGIDISEVKKENIPDHTLLVGGFPCQDYSVAHSLSTSEGIEGKKGVLWWQIRDTIIAKQPPFCLFENVDRLLKSPAKQRGRDFGIILACLNNLGYDVEWRVVNAAQYGAAQRRKRTFIFAYKNDTKYAKSVEGINDKEILDKKGFFAQAFPITSVSISNSIAIDKDVIKVSDSFRFDFENAGYMRNGNVVTATIREKEIAPIPLRKILQKNVDKKYYISDTDLPDWEYMKGAKRIPRKSSEGHEYTFSEGPIAFPDPWDKPARTMLTSEGTKNRSTHIVEDLGTKKKRILTPIETERIQGFDDDWTNTGMTERFRYFCMGNALVVPMITRMGIVLNRIIDEE